MKKLLLILLSAIALLLVSCSEDKCFIRPDGNYNQKCNTRIVSIEKFNAHYTEVKKPDGTIDSKLDSTYNIGMFKFPDNETYSGSFPNDENFESSQTASIAKMSFNNNNFFLSVEDVFPSNSDMPGDILVKKVIVHPNGNSALLRINGYIVPLDLHLETEDSQVFCDFVRANKPKINQAVSTLEISDATAFGQNLSTAIKSDYSNLDIVVYTKNNVKVGNLNDSNVPQPTTEELQNFKNMVSGKTALDFPVQAGELFGYVTRSGVRFVFLVSEIRKSPIRPYRERVSIIFQEIR